MATSEPLSALDASFLEIESATTPMHIGALSRFEGGPLRDESGAVRLAELRALVDDRIGMVPRFRQRVMDVPFGMGRPVWVDDAHFDVAYHVNLTTLPPPGTPDQLRHLTEHLHMQLLDRSRPLWELWFIDGLADGTVALLEKVHHAVLDGVAGVDVATTLFDSVPEHSPPSPSNWKPRRSPPPLALLGRALVAQAVDPARVVGRLARTLGPPGDGRARAAHFFRVLPTLAGPAALAPQSSVNRRVGRLRRFETVRLSMADIAETRAGLGGTLNDVVLAAVAGGLRYLLHSRGEPDPARPLHVLVPVSLRPAEGHAQLGNRVGAMIVPLPVQEADPLKRLEAVKTATAARKGLNQAGTMASLLGAAEHLPEPLVGAIGRLVHRQPFVNLVVTNVPGPPTSLYVLGARLLESLPIVPLGGNLDVSVGVLSYGGQLALGLLADGEACPDVAVLAEGIDKAFAELHYASDRSESEVRP